MTEQLTIMTDEYAKEFNKKHSKKPCDTPCVKKPMMGRSWWKSLGYGTPCLCAENAYDEQEKAKKDEWWKYSYDSFAEAIVGEFGDESEQAKKYSVGLYAPKEKEYTCDCQECGETIELEKYETPEEQKIWFDMEDEIKLCDECAKEEDYSDKVCAERKANGTHNYDNGNIGCWCLEEEDEEDPCDICIVCIEKYDYKNTGKMCLIHDPRDLRGED